MAKCGCVAGSCDCSVIAGTGTTVTGTGTAVDPFVVSADAPPPPPPGGCVPFVTVAASDTQPELAACATYVCDGVADDIEIQAAIDFLGVFPAGTVILLPGSFFTSDTVFLRTGTTLEGTRGASIIEYGGTGYAVSNSNGAGVGRELVTIQNLTIDGNDGGAVLLEFGTLKGVLTNCILLAEGSTLSTLSLQGTDILITNNYILADSDANGFAVTVLSYSDSNHIISDNTIYGPGGIMLDGVQGSVVSGNVIAASWSGPSSGIYLTGSTEQTIISDNVIRDFGRQGIRTDGAVFCVLTNNIIFNVGQQANNTYDGILLEGVTDALTVQGNQVRIGGGNDTRYGINVSGAGCTDNLVTNNDLWLSGATASFVDTGTATIVTAGNRL